MLKIVNIRSVRLGARDGTFTSRCTVFCPRSNQTVDLEHCSSCPFRSEEEPSADRQVITCTTSDADSVRAAGSLVLGSLTCVDAAMPFSALRTMRLPQPLIPVFDGPHEAYVGCISPSLFDIALELPPRVRVALLDSARVGDVMTSTVAIAEEVTLLAAAGAMSRARARHLPVITRSGGVAGILDDVTLLLGLSDSK